MRGRAVCTSGRPRRTLLTAPDDSPPTPTPPSPPDPSTSGLAVSGRIGPADRAALCERVGALLEAGQTGVECDVRELTDVDLGTLDALARLQLAARRRGGTVWLRHASVELQELLALAGLDGVVPCSAGLPVEPRRQPEEGEEPRRVEEERDRADPIP